VGCDVARVLANITELISISLDPHKNWVHMEVYVDDFFGMTHMLMAMTIITIAILYGIESVLLEPAITNHLGGKHPLSKKKAK
jgi:hypothetical protein